MFDGSTFVHAAHESVPASRKLAIFLFALILTFAMVPGLAWAEDEDSASSKTESSKASIDASCAIVGLDGYGDPQIWAKQTTYYLSTGSTAATLTEDAFEFAELDADYVPKGAQGFHLDTITSPYDTSLTLGYNEETGQFWQLFYNGEPAETDASNITLQSGDSIVWYYSQDGDELIDLNDSSAFSRFEGTGNVDMTNGTQEAASFEITPLFIVFIILVVIAFICMLVLMRMSFTRRTKKSDTSMPEAEVTTKSNESSKSSETQNSKNSDMPE